MQVITKTSLSHEIALHCDCNISVINCSDGAGLSIVGGKEVKAHSKPWMASIQIKHQHTCGGILIQDQWVLSAAHCKQVHLKKKINRPFEIILMMEFLYVQTF